MRGGTPCSLVTPNHYILDKGLHITTVTYRNVTLFRKPLVLSTPMSRLLPYLNDRALCLYSSKAKRTVNELVKHSTCHMDSVICDTLTH